MKRNQGVTVGVVIILASLIYFGISGFQEGKAYYKTIGELGEMGDDAYDKRLRVAGIVSAGTIIRTGTEVTFLIEQDDLSLKVIYTGTTPLPDTFKDGAEAMCDGNYQADGTFEAKTVQAKCASKYEAGYGDGESAEH